MNLENSEQFLNNCVDIIKTRFPNSKIFWKKHSLYNTFYNIKFFLANSAEETANNIMANDAMDWNFIIPSCDNNGCISDEIVIELNDSSICRAADKNDPKEKYCVYGIVKVPFRKISGDRDNCLKKLKTFIDKTANIMLQNADTINLGSIKGLFKVEDKIVH